MIIILLIFVIVVIEKFICDQKKGEENGVESETQQVGGCWKIVQFKFAPRLDYENARGAARCMGAARRCRVKLRHIFVLRVPRCEE